MRQVWPYLVIVLLSVLLIWRSWPAGSKAEEPIIAKGNLAEDERSTIKLFEQSSPSVVHVFSIRQSGPRDLGFQVEQGSGSGFIWDTQGHIVTNYHVVRDGNKFAVRLANQNSYMATLKGFDSTRDLAVLHIDVSAKELKPILRGESGNLKVGQKVFAIGNPFGLDQTLTTGVVSGLGRQVNTGRKINGSDTILHGLIQTDAAINPGNSGGPLLDSSGRLVGVNTAILSPSGASAGIGFAIPMDEVLQIVPILIRHQKVVRPSLGIREIPEQLANPILQRLGIRGGVLFSHVYPKGPASFARLQPTRRSSLDILVGDIIVAINDKQVLNPRELHTELEKYKQGTEVTVTIMRGNQLMKKQMQLSGEVR